MDGSKLIGGQCHCFFCPLCWSDHQANEGKEKKEMGSLCRDTT